MGKKSSSLAFGFYHHNPRVAGQPPAAPNLDPHCPGFYCSMLQPEASSISLCIKPSCQVEDFVRDSVRAPKSLGWRLESRVQGSPLPLPGHRKGPWIFTPGSFSVLASGSPCPLWGFQLSAVERGGTHLPGEDEPRVQHCGLGPAFPARVVPVPSALVGTQVTLSSFPLGSERGCGARPLPSSPAASLPCPSY